MTLEQYEKTLDLWANEEREKAAEAKRTGDERMHSIYLMKASMMGDMLKALGRVEMSGKKGTLAKLAAQCDAEAGRMREKEDFDAAERSAIKAETIRRAWDLLKEE